MQVCVIKNTEPKNMNIPLTATAGGAVGLARCQSRQTHDVVYGRIKRNCVDHSNPFQIWVCWPGALPLDPTKGTFEKVPLESSKLSKRIICQYLF